MGISVLFQLLKVVRIKDAIRSDLFPTADMIVSMSKEFGVPLTTKDFKGVCAKNMDSICL